MLDEHRLERRRVAWNLIFNSSILWCHARTKLFNCDGRFGDRDQGARRAEARGAGFPRHHLMVVSIAFSERVRKGSWVLFAKRRRA